MSRFERLALADYSLADELVARTLSPALVIWRERVRENLARMRGYLGGDLGRWRAHVKSAKIPSVFAELVRAGVRHFKTATTRETACLLAVLDEAGSADADVLLAYPLVGPALLRLGELARAHPRTRLSVLCEDPALCAAIPREVTVFVDVNPGMNRTGVPLEREPVIHELARRAGERLRGIHYYDGHLHDGELASRRLRAHEGYERLLRLARGLERAGFELAELVTSGTPTFRHALAFAPFSDLGHTRHRVSPGTVVYHDARSERNNPDLDLVPAALVLARVVSNPAPGVFTCDAGSKSIAAEVGDPCAFVLGHPTWTPLTPNEEHLPIRVPPGERCERGDLLLLVPEHVCPTINLAEEALLVDAHGHGQVEAVAARAHELLLARADARVAAGAAHARATLPPG